MKLSYTRAEKASISTIGRLSRRDSYQCVIALPKEAKAEIDDLIEGGSMAAALTSLVIYGLEQLKKNQGHLVLDCRE